MENNGININGYVERKLSAEIAELKVLLAKTEFNALALQEENERLKAQLAEIQNEKGKVNEDEK